MLTRTSDTQAGTPPEVKSATPPPQNSEQVIIRMDANGKTFINKLEVPRTQFAERLRTAMTGREKKLAFFAADGELSYEKVVEFMDLPKFQEWLKKYDLKSS